MLKINTNLSSLVLQHTLNRNTNGLNRAIERMTTGYKINYAKDDAAGYAIAGKMNIKRSSYEVARDNTELGLSIINTASSSLDIVTGHLQRMRDLSMQAANGTYAPDSIQAIQAEIEQRLKEIKRVVESAEFNGKKLFDNGEDLYVSGNFISEVVQLSEEDAVAQGYTVIKTADDLNNIRNNMSGKYILMGDIDLSGINWEPIGDSTNPFKGVLNGNGFVIRNLHIDSNKNFAGLFGYTCEDGSAIKNLGLEDVNIKGVNNVGGIIGMVYANTSITNCYVTGSVSGGNNVGGVVGFTQFIGPIKDVYADVDVKGNNSVGGLVGMLKSNITNSYALGTVNGNDGVGGIGGHIQGAIINNCYSNNLITGNNNTGAIVGTSVTYISSTIKNSYYNQDKTGSLPVVGDKSLDSGGATGVSTKELNGLISQNLLPIAHSPLLAPGSVITKLQVGIDSGENSVLSFNTGLSLDIVFDVLTYETARLALNKIDIALNKITAKQTELGAVQNRLESVLDSIDTNITNLTSSISTIKDADVAVESSEYIRYQILQQATATLLTTANQTPTIALQLI